MAEPVTNGLSRVKLYELGTSGRWDDRGTGYISQVEKPITEGVHIVLICEETGRILHDHRINSRIEYVQQGLTIITWPEDHGKDVALSYQDANQCNSTWQSIYDLVHTHNENNNNNSLLLPELTLETQSSTCEIIEKSCICNRDELGPILRSGSFIENLITLSRMCIYNKDYPNCYYIYRIVKNIFLCGDSVLIDDLTVPPYITDIVEILEYDPDNYLNTDEKQCFTRHQEYLCHIQFKNACMITDQEVLDRIHQSFILTYIRDVALLEYLDDFSISRITTLKYLKENAIVTRLQEASSFTQNLFITLEKLAIYTPSMKYTPSYTGNNTSPVLNLLFNTFKEHAVPEYISFVMKTQQLNEEHIPLDRLLQNTGISSVQKLDHIHAIVSSEQSHRIDIIDMIFHILQLSKSTQIITRTSFVQLQQENNFCQYIEFMLSSTPRNQTRLWPTIIEVLSLLLHNDLQATKTSQCALTTIHNTTSSIHNTNNNSIFPILFSGILSVYTNEGVKLLLNDIIRRLFNTLDSAEALSRTFLNLYLRQLTLAIDYNMDVNYFKDMEIKEEVEHATRYDLDSSMMYSKTPLKMCNMVKLIDLAGYDAVLTSEQLLTCVTCSFTEEPVEASFAYKFIPSQQQDLACPTIHVLGLLSYILRPLLGASNNTQNMVTKAIISSGALERTKTLMYSLIGTFLSSYMDVGELDKIDNPADMIGYVKHLHLLTFPPLFSNLASAAIRFVKTLVLTSDNVLMKHILQLKLLDISFFLLMINGQRQNILSGSILNLHETCEMIDDHYNLTLQCRQWREIFSNNSEYSSNMNNNLNNNTHNTSNSNSNSNHANNVYIGTDDGISEPSIPTDTSLEQQQYSLLFHALPSFVNKGDVDSDDSENDDVNVLFCNSIDTGCPSRCTTPAVSLPSSVVHSDFSTSSDDDSEDSDEAHHTPQHHHHHESDEFASFLCLTSNSPINNTNITAPKLTLSLRTSSSSLDDLLSPRSDSPCISPPLSPSTLNIQNSPQRNMFLHTASSNHSNGASPMKRTHTEMNMNNSTDSLLKKQKKEFPTVLNTSTSSSSSSSMTINLTIPTTSNNNTSNTTSNNNSLILNQGTLLSHSPPTTNTNNNLLHNNTVKQQKQNIFKIIKPLGSKNIQPSSMSTVPPSIGSKQGGSSNHTEFVEEHDDAEEEDNTTH